MSPIGHKPLSTHNRIDLAIRLLVLAELALICATWRLWFCASDFPRVPLFAGFIGTPTTGVRAVSVAFVASLLVGLWLSGHRRHRLPRWASAVMIVPGCLAVCCNQHCLQAWHWLFLLTILFRLTVPDDALFTVLKRLLPTIYIFAAVSRIGSEIDTGMSRQIVMTLLDLIGLHSIAADPGIVSWFCVGATMFELATGLLLLRRKTQFIGTAMAVVMHLVLLLALSPLGINQQAGVLVWNGFLTAWVVLLFWPNARQENRTRMAVLAASAFCFAWPTLALFGLTDNWTGWQLYSPRPEVLQLQVHADAVSELPVSVMVYAEEPDPLEAWCSVRLDRWSLQNTGVPMYPQARFQLAIAAAATAGVSNDAHVRARLISPKSPNWWNRTTIELIGRQKVFQAINLYGLNGRTRSRN